ncbi:hypothetical protein R1T40_02335 [Tritonibacter scottomollicae]|uniref:Uncharacterized protein n=1 Tax=Tritonibacter scottomollicae TaxID=483013 RepID=A0ABZ0HFK6_TRISK|nr:hypothetical protein [Tritonibacter scottomollicae]WOI33610.1 hypothetical protein R1T40_02335 [Tritonibacter scottomollicae]
MDAVDFGQAMVQVEAVRDRESFEAWLETLSEDRRKTSAVALASRAALRGLPANLMSFVSAPQNETGASSLYLFRMLLASIVFARTSSDKAKLAAYSACVDAPLDTAEVCAGRTAYADGLASSAAAVDAVFLKDTTATAAARTSLHSDLAKLKNDAEILEAPLWDSAPNTERQERAWDVIRDRMKTHTGFGFWIRWYDGILAGRSLTQDWQSHWQLMHDIALIAPEDWNSGADRVAEVIDLISQKHALKRDAAVIKRALENEIFNAETLGLHRDNLPDDLPPSRVVQYRAQLREVQEELEAVEAALEPPVPDAEVLEEATWRLHAAWERFKAICTAIGIATALGGSIYLQGAIDQAGARSMDWLLDEGAPSLIQSLRSVSPTPSPAAQASRNARGERVPDKR